MSKIRPQFYSQFGEDRLLSDLFGGRTSGTCVEVGANDGINDSTTYHFELLGWDCVLVEPNPQLAERIRAVRRGVLFECAASEDRGRATFHIAEGADRSHGVSALDAGNAPPAHFEKFGFSSRAIEVEVRTLDDILGESHLAPPIDFVSIDVEGFELSVLKGFDLARWRPRIVILEDNSAFEDRAAEDYLRSQGYVPFKRTVVNDWYARREDQALATRISTVAFQLRSAGARTRHRIGAWPGVHRVTNFVRRTFDVNF